MAIKFELNGVNLKAAEGHQINIENLKVEIDERDALLAIINNMGNILSKAADFKLREQKEKHHHEKHSHKPTKRK